MSQDGGFSYSSRFSRCDANCKIPRRHWLDLRRTPSASSQKAFGLSASAVSFCDTHRFFRAQFTPVSFSLLFSSFPEDPSYPSRGRGTRGFSEPDSTFQPRKRGVAPTGLYALQRRRSHSWKLLRRGGSWLQIPGGK